MSDKCKTEDGSSDNMQQLSKGKGQQACGVAVAAAFSGPLPPPEQLEKYERVLPGAAERIMRIAEREQQARHVETVKNSERLDKVVALNIAENANDKLLIETNSNNIKRGQVYALICVLLILIAAVICAIANHPITAGFVGTGGIASVAAVFIFGAKQKKNPPEK